MCRTLPYASLPSIWLFLSPVLLSLISNVPLSSVSHANKLMEPKEGVIGTSDLQALVISTGNNLGLQLASEVEGNLVRLSFLHVESV